MSINCKVCGCDKFKIQRITIEYSLLTSIKDFSDEDDNWRFAPGGPRISAECLGCGEIYGPYRFKDNLIDQIENQPDQYILTT
jgi:hypothetical protein